MKALVIIGHPAPHSFNHAIAAQIADAWQAAGADVTTHDLAASGFDPCLTPAEARGAPFDDPTVQRHIQDLTTADLLAVVHPVMWGMPPAIVKGWIDRVFALNAAYGFPDGAAEGVEPIGLLPLRAALILNTSNTPPDREAARFGDPLARIWHDCILGYCSTAQVSRHSFAPLVPSEAATRAAWLGQAAEMARASLHAAQTTRP
jgi:putative NADPH-quinone reductase